MENQNIEIQSIEPQIEQFNKLNHYPPSEVVEIANTLWLNTNNLEYYDGGSFKLKNLDKSIVEKLLGLDNNGHTQESGFRFTDKLINNQLIKSQPYFEGQNYLPDNKDIDQYTSGKVQVDTDTYSYSNSIVEINKISISEDLNSFSLTFIPDPKFEESQLKEYYQILNNHLN